MTLDHLNKTAPVRLHTRGLFWAVFASICITALLTVTMIFGATTSGAFWSYCNTTEPSGIFFKLQPELPSRYDEWRVKQGTDRPFPPGTQCLLYGRASTSSQPPGGRESSYELVADRYYPSQSSYFWLVLLIFSPFILLFALRLWKRVFGRKLRS